MKEIVLKLYELKRVFEVLLNHQALEILGTTNVIVDEICGEGTWAEYVARCQRWKDSQAKKEALIFEKRRKEKEDRKKKFEEQIEMWKSGKILELYLHYYLEDDQPNVWLRIKNGIIETSKNIKIERAEAERLWKLIKLFHNGSKFQHDMVLDTTGHKWKINSYKNDILVAGCHRIAYSEMKGIARIRMGLNSYQVTFESCGDHYQIYGRDIQDVMGGVTGGAGVYG